MVPREACNSFTLPSVKFYAANIILAFQHIHGLGKCTALLYCTLRYSTLPYSTLFYTTLRYSAVLYFTLLYSLFLALVACINI